MAGPPLQVDTLTPGEQRPEAVAGRLADWLRPARRTLDLALYNVRVPGPAGGRLHATVRDAAARGVAVRILVHRPDLPPLPLHAAPTPRTRLDLLRALGAQVRTVDDERKLMHHKFVVRDEEAVWTGSANWTFDDFAREENVVLQVRSPQIAAAYAAVFEELWDGGTVERTGAHDTPAARVGDAAVVPWFCPGRGRALSFRIAERIAGAKTRVRIASPVITAGPVLRALGDVRERGAVDTTGIVDATLTGHVLSQWHDAGVTWKHEVLEDVLTGLRFSGKPSVPGDGSAEAPLDIIYAKVVVADDAVFAGSFNLSRSGEENAENMLEIEDGAVADRLAAWIDRLRARARAGARGMSDPLHVRTLEDGAQPAEQIAGELVAWLDEARHALELALYDVRIPGPAGDRVAAALRAAVDRGVRVRIAVHDPEAGHGRSATPPSSRPALLEATGADVRLIDGDGDLMHHKFAVRDGAAVWSGSANWTLDSWTRQENVIATLASEPLARSFSRVFEELWQRRHIEDTADFDTQPVRVGGAHVRAWFCPGRGRELAHRIAVRIERARHRVRIASPVITSAPVLAALGDVVHDGRPDATGLVDHTQTEQALRQWRADELVRWKAPVLERVLDGLAFSGKRSHPWQPGQPNDVMHAKVTVADDVVFLGSYNLSRSGEGNAENMLEIEDRALADRLAGWIDELHERYREQRL